jgi:hypothetical protein
LAMELMWWSFWQVAMELMRWSLELLTLMWWQVFLSCWSCRNAQNKSDNHLKTDAGVVCQPNLGGWSLLHAKQDWYSHGGLVSQAHFISHFVLFLCVHLKQFKKLLCILGRHLIHITLA